MYYQVVYKYAGEGWRLYGPITPGMGAQVVKAACAGEFPTAMVGIVEGYSMADVQAKLGILLAMDGAAAGDDNAPRDVPLHEAGEGGDRDTPYTYTPPNSVEWQHWMKLWGKAKRGEVGGPNDGGETAGEGVAA